MYIVNEDDKKERLDKYLTSKLDISRSKIKEMLDNDLVLVNDKKMKDSYIIRDGDKIEIVGTLKEESDILPEDMELNIVYEDEYLMVINKPSGMVVHPACGHYSHTLVNGLLSHTSSLSGANGDTRPGIVHRIDKDTSGLLLVAKDDKTHEFLSSQLKDKTLSRTYIALVHGVIPNDTGTIDAPIGRDPKSRKKMCVTDVNAKDAITDFKVLERYKKATLLEVHLRTGRTHQIRVHMNYIGHPIVNDPVYGYKDATKFGQMLHAKEIEFIHPKTKEKMKFSCDLPDEFVNILNKYKN